KDERTFCSCYVELLPIAPTSSSSPSLQRRAPPHRSNAELLPIAPTSLRPHNKTFNSLADTCIEILNRLHSRRSKWPHQQNVFMCYHSSIICNRSIQAADMRIRHVGSGSSINIAIRAHRSSDILIT
uniref:Uncharacterized protein n=1 Tax=Parascaris univalens TaxID=6257 RepID=A0A914ZSK5_PARUN